MIVVLCCFVLFSLQSSRLRVGSRLVVDMCVEIADRRSLGIGSVAANLRLCVAATCVTRGRR